MLNLHTRPPSLLSLLFTLLFSTLVSARPQPQGLIPILTNQPLTCSDGTTTYTNGTTVVEQGRVYQVLCNTNILQTNLNVYVLPSLALCLNSCAGTPGCAGATYDKSIRQCTLKGATDTLGNVVGGLGTGVGGLLGVGNGLVALIPVGVVSTSLPSLGATRGSSVGLPSISPLLSTPSPGTSARVSTQGASAVSNANTAPPLIGLTQSINIPSILGLGSSSGSSGLPSGSASVSGSGTASASTAANPLSNIPSVIGSLLAPLTSNALPSVSISAPTSSPSTVLPLSSSKNGINSLVSNLQNLQTLLNGPSSSIGASTVALPTSLAAPSLPATSIQNPLNPLQAAVSGVVGGLNAILAVPPPSASIPSISLPSISSLPTISSAQAPSLNIISNIIGGLGSTLAVPTSLGAPISLSIPTPSSLQNPLAGVSSVVGGVNSLLAIPSPSLSLVIPGVPSSSVNNLPIPTPSISSPQNLLGNLVSNVAGGLVSLLAVPSPSLAVSAPSSVPTFNNVIGGVVSNVAGGLGSLLAATPSIPSLGVSPIVPPLSITTPSIRPAETLSLSSIGSVQNPLEGIALGLIEGLQSILVVPSLPSISGPSISSTPLATPSPVSISPLGSPSIQNPAGGILSGALGGISSLPAIPSSIPNLGLPGVPSTLLGVPSLSSITLQTPSPSALSSAQVPVGDLLSALNVGLGNLLSPSVPALGLSTLLPAVSVTPLSLPTNSAPSANGLTSVPAPLLGLASALQDLLAQPSLPVISPSLPLPSNIPSISSPVVSSIQPLLPQLASAIGVILSQQSSLEGIPSVIPIVPSSSLPATPSVSSAGNAQGLLPALGNVLGNLLGIPAVPTPSPTPLITPSPSLSPQENQLEQMLSYLSYDLGIFFPREQMMALLGIPVKPTSTILSSIVPSLAAPTSQGLIPAVLNGLGLSQSVAVPSVTLTSVLAPQTSLSTKGPPSLSSVNVGLLGEVLSALVVTLPSDALSLASPSLAVPSLTVPSFSPIVPTGSISSLLPPGPTSVQPSAADDLLGGLISNLLGVAAPTALPSTLLSQATASSVQIPSLGLPDLALPTTPLVNIQPSSLQIPSLDLSNLVLPTLQLDGNSLLSQVISQLGTPILPLPTTPLLQLLPIEIPSISLPTSPIIDLQLPTTGISEISLPSISIQPPSLNSLALSEPSLSTLLFSFATPSVLSSLPPTPTNNAPGLLDGLLGALGLDATKTDLVSSVPSVAVSSAPNLVGGLLSALDIPLGVPIPSTAPSISSASVPDLVEDILGGLVSNLASPAVSNLPSVSDFPTLLETTALPSSVGNPLGGLLSGLGGIIPSVVGDIAGAVPSILDGAPSVVPEVINAVLSPLTIIPGLLTTLPTPTVDEALIGGLVSDILNPIPSLLTNIPQLLPSITLSDIGGLNTDLSSLGNTPGPLPTVSTPDLLGDVVGGLLSALNTPIIPPLTTPSDQSIVLPTTSAINPVGALLSDLITGRDSLVLPTLLPTTPLPDIVGPLASDVLSDLAGLSVAIPSDLPTLLPSTVVENLLSDLANIPFDTPTPIIAPTLSTLQAPGLIPNLLSGLLSDVSLPTSAPTGLLIDILSGLGNLDSNVALPTLISPALLENLLSNLGGIVTRLPSLTITNVVPSAAVDPTFLGDLLGGLSSILDINAAVTSPLPTTAPSNLLNDIINDLASNLGPTPSTPVVSTGIPTTSTILDQPENILGGVFSALGLDAPSSPTLIPPSLFPSPTNSEPIGDLLGNILPSLSIGLVTPSPLLPSLLGEILTNLPPAFPSSLVLQVLQDVISNIATGVILPSSIPAIPIPSITNLGVPQDILDGVISGVAIPSSLSLPEDILTLSVPNLSDVLPDIISNILDAIPTPSPLNQLSSILNQDILGGIVTELSLGLQPSSDTLISVATTFPAPTSASRPGLNNIIPGVLSYVLENLPTPVIDPGVINSVVSGVLSELQVPSFTPPLTDVSLSTLAPIPSLSLDSLPGILSNVLEDVQPIATQVSDLGVIVNSVLSEVAVPSLSFLTALPQTSVPDLLSDLSSGLLAGLTTLDLQLPLPTNNLDDLISALILTLPAPSLVLLASNIDPNPTSGSPTIIPAVPDNILEGILSGIELDGTPSLSLPLLPSLPPVDLVNSLFSILQPSIASTLPEVSPLSQQQPSNPLDGVIQGLVSNLDIGGTPTISLPTVPTITDLSADNPIGSLLSGLQGAVPSLTVPSVAAPTTAIPDLGNIVSGILSGLQVDTSTYPLSPISLSSVEPPNLLGNLASGILSALGNRPESAGTQSATATTTNPVEQFVDDVMHGLGFDDNASTTQSGTITQSGSATPQPDIVDGVLQGLGLAPEQTTVTQSSTTRGNAIVQIVDGLASGLGAPNSLVGDVISNILGGATLLPTTSTLSILDVNSIAGEALSNLLPNLATISTPSVSPLPSFTDLGLLSLPFLTIQSVSTVSIEANVIDGLLSALGNSEILPSVLSIIPALPTSVLSSTLLTISETSLSTFPSTANGPLPTPSEDILNGIFSALNLGETNPSSTYVTSILSSLAVPGSPLSALLSAINLENLQTATATLTFPPTTLITSRKSIQPLVDVSLNLGILEGLCPTCSITSSLPLVDADISLGLLEGLCPGSSCRSSRIAVPSTPLTPIATSSAPILPTSTSARAGGLLGALGGLLGAVGLTSSVVPSTTLVASTRPVITSSAPGAGLIGGILNSLGLIPSVPVTLGIVNSPTSVTIQLPSSSRGTDNILGQLLSGILGGNTHPVIQITPNPTASQTFTVLTGTVDGNLLGGIFSGLGLGVPLPSTVASFPPNIIGDVISALGSVPSAVTPVLGPVEQLISALGATPVSSILPANVLDDLVSALGNIPLPTNLSFIPSSGLQDVISSPGNGPTPTSSPPNVLDAVISVLGAVLNPTVLPSDLPVNLLSLLGVLPTPTVGSNIQQSISTVNLLENVLSAAGGLLPTAPALPSGLNSISPDILGGLFSALQDVPTISPALDLPQITSDANIINDLLTALATSNKSPTVLQTVIPEVTSMAANQSIIGGLLGLLGGPSGSATSTDVPDLLAGLVSALNLGTILPSNTAISPEMLNSLVSNLNGIGGLTSPTGPVEPKSTEAIDALGNLFSALSLGTSLPTPTISGLDLIVPGLLGELLSNVGNSLPTSFGPFLPGQTDGVNLINDLLSALGTQPAQSAQATTESPSVNTAADLLGNILSNVGGVLGNTATPTVSQPSNAPDIFGGLLSQLGYGLNPTSSLDIPAQSLPSLVPPDLIGPLLSNIGNVIAQSTILPTNVLDNVLSNVQDLLNQPTDIATPSGIDDPDGGGDFHPLDINLGDLFSQLGLDAPETTDDLQITPLLSFLGGSSFGFGNLPGGAKPTASMSSSQFLTTAQPDLINDLISGIGVLAPAPKMTSAPTDTVPLTSPSPQASRFLDNLLSDLFNGPGPTTRTPSTPSTTLTPAALSSSVSITSDSVSITSDVASLGDDGNVGAFDQSYSEAMAKSASEAVARSASEAVARSQSEASRRSTSRTGGPVVPPQPTLPTTSKPPINPSNVFSILPISLPQSNPSTLSTLTRSSLSGAPGSTVVSCSLVTQPGPLLNVGGILNGLFGGQASGTVATTCVTIVPVSSPSSSLSSVIILSTPRPIIDLNPLASLLGLGQIPTSSFSGEQITSSQSFGITTTANPTTIAAPPLIDLNPILSAFGLGPLPSTLLSTLPSSADPSRPSSTPLLSSNKPLLDLNPVFSALLVGQEPKSSSKTGSQSPAPIITPPPGQPLLDLSPLLSAIGSNLLPSQLVNLNPVLSGLGGILPTTSVPPLINLSPLISALDVAFPSTTLVPLINLEPLQSLLVNQNSLDTTALPSTTSLIGPLVDLNPPFSFLGSRQPSLISGLLALPTSSNGPLVNLDPLLSAVMNLPSIASEILALPNIPTSPIVNLVPLLSVLGNNQGGITSDTLSGLASTLTPAPPILGTGPIINLNPLLSIIGGGLPVSTPLPLSSIGLLDLEPLLSNIVQALPTSLALPPLPSLSLVDIAPLLSIIGDVLPTTALLPGLPSPLVNLDPLLSVVTAGLPTLLPITTLPQITWTPSQLDATPSTVSFMSGTTPTEAPRPILDLNPLLSLVGSGPLPTTPLLGVSLDLGLLEGLCPGPLCRRSSTTPASPTSDAPSTNSPFPTSNNLIDEILSALGLNDQGSTVAPVHPTSVPPGLLDQILSVLDSRASSSAASFVTTTGLQRTSSQVTPANLDILPGLLSALGSPQTSRAPLLDVNLSIDLLQGFCPGPSCRTSYIGTPTTVGPSIGSLSGSSNPFTSKARPPLIGIDLSLDLLGGLCPGPSCRTSFLTRTSPGSVISSASTSFKSSPIPPKPVVDLFPLLSLLGVGGQITTTSTSASFGSSPSPFTSTTRPIVDLAPILNPVISLLGGGKGSSTKTILSLSSSVQPILSAKPFLDVDPLLSLLGLGQNPSSTLSPGPSATRAPPLVNINLSLGVLEGLCPGPSCRSATSRQGSAATTTTTGPVSVASNAGTRPPLIDINLSLDVLGGLCNGPNCRTSSPTSPSLTTTRTLAPQITTSSPSTTKSSTGVPSKRPGILDINLSLGVLEGLCPGPSCRSSAATVTQAKPPPLIDLNLSLDLLGGLCQGPNCRSSGTSSRVLATNSLASIPTSGSSSMLSSTPAPTSESSSMPSSTPAFTSESSSVFIVPLTSSSSSAISLTSSTISPTAERETTSVASATPRTAVYSSTSRVATSRPPLIDINLSLDILGGLCPTCKPRTSTQRVTSIATVSVQSSIASTNRGPSSRPPLIDLDISLDLLGGLCPTCRPKTTSPPIIVTRTAPSPVSRPPLIDVDVSLGILEALCPGPNCRTKVSKTTKPPLIDVKLSLGLPSFGIFNFPDEPTPTATTSYRSASRSVITSGGASVRSSTGRTTTSQSTYKSSVSESSVNSGIVSTKRTGSSIFQQSSTRATSNTRSTVPTSSRIGSTTKVSLTTPTRKTSVKTQRTTTNTRTFSSTRTRTSIGSVKTSRSSSRSVLSTRKVSSTTKNAQTTLRPASTTSVLSRRSRTSVFKSSTKTSVRTNPALTSRSRSNTLSSRTRTTVRAISSSTSRSKSSVISSSARTTGRSTPVPTSRSKSSVRSSSTKTSATTVLTSRSRSNLLSSSTKIKSRTTATLTSRSRSSVLSGSTKATVRTTSGSTSRSKSNTIFSSTKTTFGASSTQINQSSTSIITLPSTSLRSGRSSAATGFTQPPQPTGGPTSRTDSGTKPSAASECCVVGDGGILTSVFAQLSIDFQVSCNRMTTGEDLDDNQPIMTGATFLACVDTCARNTLCVGVAWNQGTGDCALQRSTGPDAATINGICAAVRDQAASTSSQAVSSATLRSSVRSLSSLQPSSSFTTSGSSGSSLPSFASTSISKGRSSSFSVNSGSSNPTTQRTSTTSNTGPSSTRTSARSASSSSGSSSGTSTKSASPTSSSNYRKTTTTSSVTTSSSTPTSVSSYTTPSLSSSTSILSSKPLSPSSYTSFGSSGILTSTSTLNQSTLSVQSTSVPTSVTSSTATQPGVQSSGQPSITTASSVSFTVSDSGLQSSQTTTSRQSINTSSLGTRDVSTNTDTNSSASVASSNILISSSPSAEVSRSITTGSLVTVSTVNIPTSTSSQGPPLSSTGTVSSRQTLTIGSTTTNTPTVAPKSCCGVSAGETYADGSISYRASCDNNLQSGDLRTVLLVTFGQCVQRCTTTSLCAAVVYNPALTACNLKSFIGPSQAAGGLCVMEKRVPASSNLLSTSTNAAITTQTTSATLTESSSQSPPFLTSAVTETGSGRSFPGPGTPSMSQGPGAEGISTTSLLTSSDGSISVNLSTDSLQASTTREIITSEPMIRSPTTTSVPLPTSSKRVSPNGLCGFPFEYTCEGSGFGNCCGAGGICGSNDFYCGRGCNPRYGTCISPSAVPITSTSARLQQTQTTEQTTMTSDANISLPPGPDSILSSRSTSGIGVNAISTRTKTVASPNEPSQPVQSSTSGQTVSPVPSRTVTARTTLSIPGPGIYTPTSGLEDEGFGRSITSSGSPVPPLQPQTSSSFQEPSISTRSDNPSITSGPTPPGPESTSRPTVTSKVIGIPDIPPEPTTDPISSTDSVSLLTRSSISAGAPSAKSTSVSRTRTRTRSRTRTTRTSTSERRPLPSVSRPTPSTSRPPFTERTITTSQGSIVNPSGVSGRFTIGGEGLATQTTTGPTSSTSSKPFSVPGRITLAPSGPRSRKTRSSTRRTTQITIRDTSQFISGSSTSSVIRSTSSVPAKSTSRSSVATSSSTTSRATTVNSSAVTGNDTLSNANAATTSTRSNSRSTNTGSALSFTARSTSRSGTSSTTRSLSRSSSRSLPRVTTSSRLLSSSGATIVLPSGVPGANTLTGAGVNTGSTRSTTRPTTRRSSSTRSRISTINGPSGISGIDTLTDAGAGSQTPTSTRSRTGISSRTTGSSSHPTSTRQSSTAESSTKSTSRPTSRPTSRATSLPSSQSTSRRSTTPTSTRSSRISSTRTTPTETTRIPSITSRPTTSRSIVTPSGRTGGGSLTGAQDPGDLSDITSRSRSRTRTRTSPTITSTPGAGGGDPNEPDYTPIASLPWWEWNEPAEGGDGVLTESDDDGYGRGDDEDDGNDGGDGSPSGGNCDCECDWYWTDEEDTAGEGVSWDWVDGVSRSSFCSATPTPTPTIIPTSTELDWEWYWEYTTPTPVATPAWEWRWHWVSYTEDAGSAPTSAAPSPTEDVVWKWHWVYTTVNEAPWAEPTPEVEHDGWEWESGRPTSSAPIPSRSGTPRQCPSRCLSATSSLAPTKTSVISTRTEVPSTTQGASTPGQTLGWRDGILSSESFPGEETATAWRDGELFSRR